MLTYAGALSKGLGATRILVRGTFFRRSGLTSVYIVNGLFIAAHALADGQGWKEPTVQGRRRIPRVGHRRRRSTACRWPCARYRVAGVRAGGRPLRWLRSRDLPL